MRKFLLYLYIVLIGVSVTGFSIQNTFAEERRTITFSSGYLEEYYTNKQIANFGMEFLEDTNFLFDRLRKVIKKEIDDELPKYILSYIPYVVNFCFIFTFDISYHEFGHAMRFKAMGYDYLFIKSRIKNSDEKRYYDNKEEYNEIINDIKANNKNFFKYFLDKIY